MFMRPFFCEYTKKAKQIKGGVLRHEAPPSLFRNDLLDFRE